MTKIYVLCDMEGTSGICRPEQVQPQSSGYAEGRELLIGDVNAAISGAFDGGADQVIACDTHNGGNNFILEKMDQRAICETPAMGSLMPSLDRSFAGLILTGHHAMAGTLNGFLDHTQDSGSWYNYFINEAKVGEIGQETAFAGHFDVPLIMVTADEAGCAEAQSQFPGIVAVSVKKGLGRNRARCIHSHKAHGLIRSGAAEAVRKAKSLEPWKIKLPAQITLEYYRSDYADNAASRPGVERVGPRAVSWVIESALDVIRY